MAKERREFLKRLTTGLGAAAATAALAKDAPAAQAPMATPSPPVDVHVNWPCKSCGTENSTPADVFQWTKMRMHCGHCGARQFYFIHLKKYDPNPTEAGKSAGHVLIDILETGQKIKER